MTCGTIFFILPLVQQKKLYNFIIIVTSKKRSNSNVPNRASKLNVLELMDELNS